MDLEADTDVCDHVVSPQSAAVPVRGAVVPALFRAVEGWARARGGGWLKIETQNINAACRFYQEMGCTLGGIDRFAYPGCRGRCSCCGGRRCRRPATVLPADLYQAGLQLTAESARRPTRRLPNDGRAGVGAIF